MTLVVGLGIGMGCSSGVMGRRPIKVDSTVAPPPEGGIAPHELAEIQLMLQQREVSTRKCYQDVLNEKQDRSFQGTVKVLIDLQSSGQAKSVEVVGGTLNDSEVQTCLVQTISQFEFPQMEHDGQAQYEFQFSPAY